MRGAELKVHEAAHKYEAGGDIGRRPIWRSSWRPTPVLFPPNCAEQTHGGFGYAEEYDIERKFRETRLYQVAPISTNMILSYLAEHVLGLPAVVLMSRRPRGTVTSPRERGEVSMLPLEGLLVVSIEQAVAAPQCTCRLADAGARVIKVERPEGTDFARHYDYIVHGESAHFVWLNRGKQSMGARPHRGRRQETARGPCSAKADVFVQNLKPGALAKLGFAFKRCARTIRG